MLNGVSPNRLRWLFTCSKARLISHRRSRAIRGWHKPVSVEGANQESSGERGNVAAVKTDTAAFGTQGFFGVSRCPAGHDKKMLHRLVVRYPGGNLAGVYLSRRSGV